MRRSAAIAAGVAGVVLAAGSIAASEALEDSSSSSVAAIPGTIAPAGTYPYGTTLAEGWVQGRCAAFLPPEVDPCDAVDGTLRHSALGAFRRGAYHAKWEKANPGEVSRLASIMAAPVCSTPSSPQPAVMLTRYGEGLAHVVRAIACARHNEPVTWPPLDPPLDPNRTDKTPPTAPGPVTVIPGG